MELTPIVCIVQDYIQGRSVDDIRLRQAILELPDNKTEHLPGYLPLELLPENIAKAAKLNKKTTKLSVKRKALPLIPAYSMTTHKSQGQTLGKIIVDLVMPSGPLEVASVYVPLSRVKRLDDLLIIRPFEFATLQVKSSTAQIEELKRLDKIAQNTWKRFQFFV
ncbi:unnamed protein product [Rotaria sordida]|uniref:ATP-dependent DNA helicase n=1 Tax=Rotaria sordida TaxID=392033 RepID=A0A819X3D6_9BILA|nr:unnamed protein product [Rotaria sordida]CAF4133862.1 unnamed protein product [Rotaria sordida]